LGSIRSAKEIAPKRSAFYFLNSNLTTMKKDSKAIAKKAIQDYINIAFPKDIDPLDSLISPVYCFLDSDFDGNMFEYHYSIMRFFVAISDPEIATVLQKKMYGYHYEVFIDMVERMEAFIRDIDNEKVKAFLHLHDIDCVGDLQEEDFTNLTAKYTKRVVELKAGMAAG
jgi:hypothetical protein